MSERPTQEATHCLLLSFPSKCVPEHDEKYDLGVKDKKLNSLNCQADGKHQSFCIFSPPRRVFSNIWSKIPSPKQLFVNSVHSKSRRQFRNCSGRHAFQHLPVIPRLLQKTLPPLLKDIWSTTISVRHEDITREQDQMGA